MSEVGIENILDAIEVNEEDVKPVEYFKVLKGKLNNINEEELQTSLNYIAEQIIAAKKVGQTTFLRKVWDAAGLRVQVTGE